MLYGKVPPWVGRRATDGNGVLGREGGVSQQDEGEDSIF